MPLTARHLRERENVVRELNEVNASLYSLRAFYGRLDRRGIAHRKSDTSEQLLLARQAGLLQRLDQLDGAGELPDAWYQR